MEYAFVPLIFTMTKDQIRKRAILNLTDPFSSKRDKESIERWHKNQRHRISQNKGKEKIFNSFRIRVAEVFKDYSFS